MSLMRRLLNLSLCVTERRFLARSGDHLRARAAFERKARFWFRPPRGAAFRPDVLRADGCQVDVLWAAAGHAKRQARVVLYLHGGGYFMGSPDTHRAMAAHLSAVSGLPVCLPAYRLAPEAPFPAAYRDACTAWDGLLAQGYDPDRIVLGGDSAGGGLALALLAGLMRAGRPGPCATFAFSPLADLTLSGASLRDNDATEVLLPPARMAEVVQGYLAGADPRDPRASPLFADFTGAGPVWLYASSSEILLDDTRRMAAVLSAQGVDVTAVVERGLPHAWPIFAGLLPEARRTLVDLADRIGAR